MIQIVCAAKEGKGKRLGSKVNVHRPASHWNNLSPAAAMEGAQPVNADSWTFGVHYFQISIWPDALRNTFKCVMQNQRVP